MFVGVSLALALGLPSSAAAQRSTNAQAPSTAPARAVRRDIPLTNMIRRAFAEGTRDSTGRPGRNYWQLRTDYTINAKFDPTSGLLTGQEHVVVQNNSDSTMNVIVLRLDQNLFAANVPKAEAVTQITDGMQLSSLSVDGKPVDLTPPPRRRRFGQPAPQVTLAAYDTGMTVATITLPDPVAAHGSFTLDANWHFTVPKVVSPERGIRMGAWGDSLYQVGQWYPRVAVYDDLRGWDTDPYLGPSEFYNNFGHFDVKLDLPAGWLVGATGTLQNPDEVLSPLERERLTHVMSADSTVRIISPSEFGAGKATAAGDRLVWHFTADTVGDVAWATSDQFVWDATHVKIPGGADVPINIMYLPGHEEQYSRAGPIATHALSFYSRRWMPYTFPTLTIVDGPELGMEYPMFIMSSAGAADHEIGHQWWPMMVGTNETWYGFMDEGFNQYMNILSRDDRMNQPPDLDGYGMAYGQVSGDEREAPLMWDANFGGPMYSFQAYGKAPMMLSMLGGVVGDSALWRAMSSYAKAWRFKHPSPWDYAFYLDHALNQNLDWFWYYWLFTTDAVDGSIQQVRTSGANTVVTVRQDGQMPSPVVLAVHFAPTGPAIRKMANAVIQDDSTAIVTYPVSVWFDGRRTFQATLNFGPRKIERTVLDPHCRFPDNEASDNTWPRQPAPADTAETRGRRRGPVCRG
jgi:hypothetical protein